MNRFFRLFISRFYYLVSAYGNKVLINYYLVLFLLNPCKKLLNLGNGKPVFNL